MCLLQLPLEVLRQCAECLWGRCAILVQVIVALAVVQAGGGVRVVAGASCCERRVRRLSVGISGEETDEWKSHFVAASGLRYGVPLSIAEPSVRVAALEPKTLHVSADFARLYIPQATIYPIRSDPCRTSDTVLVTPRSAEGLLARSSDRTVLRLKLGGGVTEARAFCK